MSEFSLFSSTLQESVRKKSVSRWTILTLSFVRLTRPLWLLGACGTSTSRDVVIARSCDLWIKSARYLRNLVHLGYTNERKGYKYCIWGVGAANTGTCRVHICVRRLSRSPHGERGTSDVLAGILMLVRSGSVAARSRACAPASIDRGPAGSFRSQWAADPHRDSYWATNALNAILNWDTICLCLCFINVFFFIEYFAWNRFFILLDKILEK